MRFGEYIVLQLEEPRVYDSRGGYIRRYVCRCSCGLERAIAASTIKGRPPVSCIACRRSRNLKPNEDFRAARRKYSKGNLEHLAKVIIESGVKIGWFTVSEPTTDNSGQKAWRCHCECGVEVVKTPSQIRYSTNTSCKACADQRRRLHVESSALSHIINGYRQRAKRRKLLFELSRSDVLRLIRMPCSYCGVASGNTYKKPTTGEVYHYNGLDRVDPAGCYTADNVVACCGGCNVAKLDRSKGEFIAHVRRIVEHLNAVETRI